MTYIVNEKCIKCKLMDCVEVCPVDCFYEGKNMLVIKPDECIDCGVCEPECPVDAIKADTEPVWLISFYFSLAITLLSFFTIPQGWVMPSFNHMILLSFVGIFGGVANLWLSQSYKYSEVSLVTPLKYLALVFAIIFGYLIWGEIPTFKTLIGAFLVIISTLIIFRREIYKKKNITSKTIND